MRKDLCRHCGNEVDRTEGLSAAETEMCAGCLAAYRTIGTVPDYGEHRGSRPGVDPLFHDEKLQGFSEEMRPRILQHLGGRR